MGDIEILGLALLLLGGFLVGGVVSRVRAGRTITAVVLGILAALAVAAGVLRLLPS